ncbi:hypothetical protein PRIPAC_85541 [Pristionchus pacificus]|uniref:TFIIIC_sub6 domain-containing protein n=1 Tax=Pristionchus pacificus TaxID=54126 RepID=A0A2A6BU34_PRIPA|nr:hypothetical protein PRIPAC_85541 [Pristionchus pacificus]|eukprot:PDM69398.1 hypothetical protein PRIPAC_44494 [Pristionchus pacificus]
MPRKGATQKPAPVASVSDDDEWEEQIMIAEVDGVLDAKIFRDAVEAGNVAIRHPETTNPFIQVGNSLYTGHWSRAIGTHIILQAENNQHLKVLSVNSKMLKTEKALLTAVGEKDKKAAAAAVSTKSPSKAAPKC